MIQALRAWNNKWTPFGSAFGALMAIYLPQLILQPAVPLLVAMPFTKNTRLFVVHMLIQLMTLGIIHIVLTKWYKKKWSDIGLGYLKNAKIYWAFIAFPIYICATFAITAILQTIQPLQTQLNAEQQLGYSGLQGVELLLTFLTLVVVAPVVEEIIFRGFLFTTFRQRLSFGWTTFAVSMLFAVAHGQLNVGIDVFVLSFFLCYLREKTGSLWPSIALHSLKNLVAFLIVFIMN